MGRAEVRDVGFEVSISSDWGCVGWQELQSQVSCLRYPGIIDFQKTGKSSRENGKARSVPCHTLKANKHFPMWTFEKLG